MTTPSVKVIEIKTQKIETFGNEFIFYFDYNYSQLYEISCG